MKRRQFLATACATGLAAATLQTANSVEPSDRPRFLDFRMVTASNKERLEALVKYNGEVQLPIVNKLGISPVGIFIADSTLNSKEQNYDKKYDNVMFGFIPHSSVESALELGAKVRSDSQFRESDAALSQEATSRNPLFTAHERMLLRCFPEFPTVKAPPLNPGRILQLRMYRSHNFERNRAKVHQLTEGGAIALFEECGIKPVFFGTTAYGSFMPSIVFMLAFDSEEQKNDAWAKFVNHPDWQKLRNDPLYADTATEIINIYLKPCKGSQI